MKKMTVSEFGRFLAGKRQDNVILRSDNQQGELQDLPVSYSLTFREIRTAISPNAVILRGESGTICLRKTKYVVVNAEKSVLGTVVDVVCDSFSAPPREIHYTLIMN